MFVEEVPVLFKLDPVDADDEPQMLTTLGYELLDVLNGHFEIVEAVIKV